MARNPTTFSRLSTGYKDSKNTIGESGYDLSAIDAYISGSLTNAGDATSATGVFTSTLSVGGAATLQSTATVRGQLTASNGLLASSGATFNSTVSVGGAATLGGAITGLSTLTQAGQITATGGVAVGGGANVVALSTATAAVSLGAIAPNESSSVQTVALSGLTRGDALFITLDSIYPNVDANRDVVWHASSSSTAGEAHVWGVNSTLTSVTPTAATVIRLTRLNFASYL